MTNIPAMPVNRTQLATALREARAARGWSQAELASTVGCSTETISRIEREAFEPALSTMADLAGALGLTIDELVTGNSRAKDLRADERNWLRIYEQLPPQARQSLITLGQMAVKGRNR
jgi:putative transcriptional regulator